MVRQEAKGRTMRRRSGRARRKPPGRPAARSRIAHADRGSQPLAGLPVDAATLRGAPSNPRTEAIWAIVGLVTCIAMTCRVAAAATAANRGGVSDDGR